MKPRDFSNALHDAADLTSSKGLSTIAAAFSDSSASTVAAHLKRSVAATKAAQGASTLEIIGDLQRLQVFVAKYGSAAFAKDLLALAEAASRSAASSAEEFAEDLRLTLVQPSIRVKSEVNQALAAEYARKLEATLGDDPGFQSLFVALNEDKSVGKAEAALIAKLFVGISGKSRADSLKKIGSRHQSLMAQRAKSDSRDGRSAA